MTRHLPSRPSSFERAGSTQFKNGFKRRCRPEVREWTLVRERTLNRWDSAARGRRMRTTRRVSLALIVVRVSLRMRAGASVRVCVCARRLSVYCPRACARTQIACVRPRLGATEEEEAGQPADQRRLLPPVHSDAVLGVCATDNPNELISASDDRVQHRCRPLSCRAALPRLGHADHLAL
jgi:hypothetical protein